MRCAGVLLLLSTMACAQRATPTPAAASDRARQANTPKQAIDLLGMPAPSTTVPLVDEPRTIHVPSGRVTLVVFTGSWSGGSMIALRAVANIARRFADLEIAAVAMDEKADDARAFARACGVSFPIAHEPWGAKSAGAWGQNPYLPNTVFLIDRRGIVRYIGRGGKDGWSREVEKEIPAEVEKLLAER